MNFVINSKKKAKKKLVKKNTIKKAKKKLVKKNTIKKAKKKIKRNKFSKKYKKKNKAGSIYETIIDTIDMINDIKIKEIFDNLVVKLGENLKCKKTYSRLKNPVISTKDGNLYDDSTVNMYNDLNNHNTVSNINIKHINNEFDKFYEFYKSINQDDNQQQEKKEQDEKKEIKKKEIKEILIKLMNMLYDQLLCPISLEICNPDNDDNDDNEPCKLIIASDGILYDENSFVKYYRNSQNFVSPITREPLQSSYIINPNINCINMIFNNTLKYIKNSHHDIKSIMEEDNENIKSFKRDYKLNDNKVIQLSNLSSNRTPPRDMLAESMPPTPVSRRESRNRRNPSPVLLSRPSTPLSQRRSRQPPAEEEDISEINMGMRDLSVEPGTRVPSPSSR